MPGAGTSSRYTHAGGQRSKLDEDLGGRPVLHRTVEAFTNYNDPETEIASITVAGPHDDEAFETFQLRHADKLAMLGVNTIRGGKTHRYETVAALVQSVPDNITHIAIHDAARPCVSSHLIERIFRAAREHPAVVPALPIGDTLKRAEPNPLPQAAQDPLASILGASASSGMDAYAILQTVDRANLWAVQTPQVFEADLIRRAYAQPNLTSTDDASLVEQLGVRVVMIEGDAENIKITRPVDLRLAHTILGVKPPAERPAHKRF